MTKRTDDHAIDLETSIEGAKKASQVIREIRDGGSVICEIRASFKKGHEQEQERFLRECRIALEAERNRRRFRFLVERGFGSSRVHPWAPHLQMSP